MAIYSIKDIEKLCGIKAHTIRIWEQRYGIIKPKRTQTNIRYYQEGDVKELLNIALLNRNGYKISKIAKMSEAEILEAVDQITESSTMPTEDQEDALTLSMIRMDEHQFQKVINSSIRQLGFERCVFEVIYPFLEKLGVLWMTGSINPVQENFISNLIRQKIISAIDQIPVALGYKVKKFMLYLPEGEQQELSILLLHYLLKARQYQVIYLGKDISKAGLKYAYRIHRPDYIFSIISEAAVQPSLQEYLDQLLDIFPVSQLLLTGYQLITHNIESQERLKVLNSLEETLRFIDNLPPIAPSASKAPE